MPTEGSARLRARHNDEVEVCLRGRRKELLGFHRLNVSAELNKIFPSSNRLENGIRNLRLGLDSVTRWTTPGGSDVVSRWMAAGLIRGEQGFRRVQRYYRLGEPGVV